MYVKNRVRFISRINSAKYIRFSWRIYIYLTSDYYDDATAADENWRGSNQGANWMKNEWMDRFKRCCWVLFISVARTLALSFENPSPSLVDVFRSGFRRRLCREDSLINFNLFSKPPLQVQLRNSRYLWTSIIIWRESVSSGTLGASSSIWSPNWRHTVFTSALEYSLAALSNFL